MDSPIAGCRLVTDYSSEATDVIALWSRAYREGMFPMLMFAFLLGSQETDGPGWSKEDAGRSLPPGSSYCKKAPYRLTYFFKARGPTSAP